VAHPKHEAVRHRYEYRCGYCGISETEAGGELTVDHFQPVSAGGPDENDNLVYACFRCNLFKADYYGNPDPQSGSPMLLHPLLDEVDAHIREQSDGTLTPMSERGRFHLEIFHLNRPQLVAHRSRASEMDLLRQRERLLTAMLEQAQKMLNEMRLYIDGLE